MFALSGIGAYGDEWSQFISGEIICHLGGRTTIMPVINVFDTRMDNRYIESDVASTLDCLVSRFGLKETSYLSRMVEIIQKPGTPNYNRVQLIDALEKATGEKFGYQMIGYSDNELTHEMKKTNKKALKRIRKWWMARQSENSESSRNREKK